MTVEAGLDAADTPVRSLFERVHGLAVGASPDLPAIAEALAAFAADRDYLDRWIARLGDRSGALPIYAPTRGPRLTLVHRPEGGMSAVHDHGTWVAICPIVGTETHRRWQVIRESPDAAPGIEIADDRALSATETAILLPPDDVHDHGHLAGRGAPAHVLILLGDDQTRFTRNEWDAATGRHRILVPGDGGRWMASDPWPEPPGISRPADPRSPSP